MYTKEIFTRSIQFVGGDKHSYNAYLVSPVQTPLHNQFAGIILVHDCWGMSQHSCEIAENFARYGCIVLLPDLYNNPPPLTQAQADTMMYQLNWHRAAEHIVTGAAHYLAMDCRQVYVVGLSMGSSIAVLASTLGAPIDKYVCFYGLPESTDWPVERICAPMQGHFVASEHNDLWCPPDKVQAFTNLMVKNNRQIEIHWYKDAIHGFMNHRKKAMYCARDCQLATHRTMVFLGMI